MLIKIYYSNFIVDNNTLFVYLWTESHGLQNVYKTIFHGLIGIQFSLSQHFVFFVKWIRKLSNCTGLFFLPEWGRILIKKKVNFLYEKYIIFWLYDSGGMVQKRE